VALITASLTGFLDYERRFLKEKVTGLKPITDYHTPGIKTPNSQPEGE
jgi:hypothetical protein